MREAICLHDRFFIQHLSIFHRFAASLRVGHNPKKTAVMTTGVLPVMSKLPQITLYFWIMKICATTLGETAGDLLSMTLNVGYAMGSLILISFFFITLVVQLVSKKHHPLLYWAVILSASIAGTTMSDYMDRTLGL